MAAPDRKSRLSPPLMYAFRSAHEQKDARKPLDLRDAQGERLIAARRQSVRAAINEPSLRREVARDLDNLMNAVALESAEDLEPFASVRASILNHGFPDIAHRTIDEQRTYDLGREIKLALLRFEPRLLGESISVTRDEDVDQAALKVRFIVRADLVCAPVNVAVEFVADVELDNGTIAIGRL